MKKETKEIKVTQSKVVFIAEDGREFVTEEECRKYEESASFAVKTLLIQNKTLVYIPQERSLPKTGAVYFGLDSLFGCCCDDMFYLFKPGTEEDVKLFLQYIKLTVCLDSFDYKKRTKENCPLLAENLFIDDSKDWEKYRTELSLEDLTPGKTYIYRNCDGWGAIYEVEHFKETLSFIVDTLVKQYSK